MTEELLKILRHRVNRRGLALARGKVLRAELGCDAQELERTLASLVEADRLEILAPVPFLVVALKPLSWSGRFRDRVNQVPSNSSISAASHREVPVSSAAAAAKQSREVGGAGEGEALLDEVLEVLGPDADRSEFRTILASHHPALIRRCLARVQSTRNIRVSRAALFRSLLTKLSN